MTERVVPLKLKIQWEPNVPRAVLQSTDGGVTSLTLAAHLDDDDQRPMVLT